MHLASPTMGLLEKAEESRGKLLQKLTKEKKKYIEQVSPQRKTLLQEGIQAQRRILERLRDKSVSKKASKRILRRKAVQAVLKPSPASKKPHPAITPNFGKKLGDISSLKREIESKLEKQKEGFSTVPAEFRKPAEGYLFTGIPGFDALLEKGIPLGAAVLLAGGAGSGKTIFGLQMAAYHVNRGAKVLYMSFEESEERLITHLENFGWAPKKLLKSGRLMIKRFNPFEITRNVDALLMKAQGELLIDVQPIIFPKGFKPEIVVVDSLTALASAFTGKDNSYRMYIEQLFRFFEQIGATSFMITETEEVPKIFSTTGVEEFLADAVVVLYNIRRGNVREKAIEILKLRGAGHQQKIVAMSITSKGIEVFPEQEVFGEI